MSYKMYQKSRIIWPVLAEQYFSLVSKCYLRPITDGLRNTWYRKIWPLFQQWCVRMRIWMQTLSWKLILILIKRKLFSTREGSNSLVSMLYVVLVTERGISSTVNTRGGFTRTSAPLWARSQDAFLVIRRSRDRAQLATLMGLCKVIWVPFQFECLSFTLVTPTWYEHAA